MPKILIVDDESFRETAALEFGLRKWDVEKANSADAAISLLESNPERFDAILLDMNMPGKSGAEVLTSLYRRGLLDDICVVVLTGYY